jgi:PAS domain S-box-containing protein
LFLAEAALTAQLEHPNIVPIHDVGIDHDDRMFYIMRRINGTAWRDVIETTTLSKNLAILLDVADAVAFAHSRRVIHRDLKPQNVLLGAFGEVLLTDWGLALSLADRHKGDAAAFEIPAGGTPAYMAPEMAAGDHRHIGPATDIYLLGAILYQIVTGKPPHCGKRIIDCLRRAVENRVELPKELGELSAIVRKAMATDPADRYATVQNFQQAIRDFQSHIESHHLCERAKTIAQGACEKWNYEQFGLALATFQEALKLWAGNETAQREAAETRMAYAKCACDKGDLDLAESLLPAAGAQDSPLADKIRQLKQQRRQIAEEQSKLRLNVEKWTTAFLASPDCVLITRLADGTILEANDVFLRTMQCSRDEVVGKSASQLNNWVDLDDRESFVRQLQQTGECNLETRFLTFGGDILPMALSGRVLTIDGERAVISHARDLTSNKQTAVQLSDAQLRVASLENVINSLPYAVLILDAEGTVLEANETASSLLSICFGTGSSQAAFKLMPSDRDDEQWCERLHLALFGQQQTLNCGFGLTDDAGSPDYTVQLSKLDYRGSEALLCIVTPI